MFTLKAGATPERPDDYDALRAMALCRTAAQDRLMRARRDGAEKHACRAEATRAVRDAAMRVREMLRRAVLLRGCLKMIRSNELRDRGDMKDDASVAA